MTAGDYKRYSETSRLITNDQNSSFEILLQNNKDITVHQIKLQILMTEIFKIVKGKAPAIMKNFTGKTFLILEISKL